MTKLVTLCGGVRFGVEFHGVRAELTAAVIHWMGLRMTSVMTPLRGHKQVLTDSGRTDVIA